MPLSQQPQVTPPNPEDKSLADYSGVLQRLFSQLFQVAHKHVGKNGVLTSFPSSKDGAAGDVLIAVVSGSAYICFKIDHVNWYKISATHV